MVPLTVIADAEAEHAWRIPTRRLNHALLVNKLAVRDEHVRHTGSCARAPARGGKHSLHVGRAEVCFAGTEKRHRSAQAAWRFADMSGKEGGGAVAKHCDVEDGASWQLLQCCSRKQKQRRKPTV